MHLMQMVSKGHNLHEMSNFCFLGKIIKKNIISVLPAELAQRVLKVNGPLIQDLLQDEGHYYLVKPEA